jgi:hypothetical protein
VERPVVLELGPGSSWDEAAPGSVASVIARTTFAVSLPVAIAVPVEGFFRYGEGRRRCRRGAELLQAAEPGLNQED